MHPLTDPAREMLIAVVSDELVAFDRETGDVSWRSQLPHAWKSDLFIGGGRVFVLQSPNLYCFGYETGEFFGRVELPFESTSANPKMLWDAGKLFVMDGYCFACISEDGKLEWSNTEFKSAGQKGPFGFPGNVSRPDYTK